ncbi:MAG: hypothetical protein IJ789_01340 [Bacteroidales bacterium]|nr:hypothetical protein [Bacteroidales bacterium]
MKRLLAILALVAATTIVQAQVDTLQPTTTTPADTAQSLVADSLGAPQHRHHHRRHNPSIGENTIVNQYEEPQYGRPRHNVMRYFGSEYCTLFAETDILMGLRDVGMGFSLTYLPETWGGYGGYIYGLRYDWLRGGVTYRPEWDTFGSTDCQLYAGLNLGQGLGVEAGVRLATTRQHNPGSFCWSSVTFGLMRNAGHTYATFGLSLDLIYIPALLLLL